MDGITITQAIEQDVTRIEGGWRVRTTERYYLDVLKMAHGNWRLVTTFRDADWEYGRGWCFQQDLAAVLLRCFTFDSEQGEEPAGWVKEVRTERRACAAYYRSKVRAHRGYDPDCPDCGNEALA